MTKNLVSFDRLVNGVRTDSLWEIHRQFLVNRYSRIYHQGGPQQLGSAEGLRRLLELAYFDDDNWGRTMRMFFGLVTCFALASVMLTSVSSAAEPELIAVEKLAPNTIFGGQWVQPDAQGAVSGTVVSAAGNVADLSGKVELVVAGSAAISAVVDTAGKFQFANLRPGVYSLVYSGNETFAAFALTVVPANSSAGLGSSTVVPATSLNPQRTLATIARYQPARIPTLPAPAEELKPLIQGVAAPNLGNYRVARNADGGLSGQLIQSTVTDKGPLAASGMNVIVLQNDEVVAQVTSDFDGGFKTDALELGTYDLIISGGYGYAAVGFELVENQKKVTQTVAAGTETLVSLLQDGAVPTEILIQTSSTMPVPSGQTEDDDAIGTPIVDMGFAPMDAGFAPGGFGGGGAGGFGGGGGGGFGGGGLGGLAAVGGIIAALLANNDDDNFVPRITSPAVP